MSDANRDPFHEEGDFAEWASEMGKDYVPGSQSADMPKREWSDERLDAQISFVEAELDALEGAIRARGELTPEQAVLDRVELATQEAEAIAMEWGERALEWLIENPEKTIHDFPG